MIAAAIALASIRFEPTDLELEDPGVLDVDVQAGAFAGDPSRPLVTDLELDLGLLPNLELNVDAAFYGEGPSGGAFRFDRRRADPLWTAVKFEMIDARDPARGTAWAFGAQIGPRFALARDLRGIGYESLLLLGRAIPHWQLVANGGMIYDAPTGEVPRRTLGFEIGLDVTRMLDARWSLVAEVATVRFVSDDPAQIYATFGVARSMGKWLDLSAIVLGGYPPNGDRFGILLGASPKIRLF